MPEDFIWLSSHTFSRTPGSQDVSSPNSTASHAWSQNYRLTRRLAYILWRPGHEESLSSSPVWRPIKISLSFRACVPFLPVHNNKTPKCFFAGFKKWDFGTQVCRVQKTIGYPSSDRKSKSHQGNINFNVEQTQTLHSVLSQSFILEQPCVVADVFCRTVFPKRQGGLFQAEVSHNSQISVFLDLPRLHVSNFVNKNNVCTCGDEGLLDFNAKLVLLRELCLLLLKLLCSIWKLFLPPFSSFFLSIVFPSKNISSHSTPTHACSVCQHPHVYLNEAIFGFVACGKWVWAHLPLQRTENQNLTTPVYETTIHETISQNSCTHEPCWLCVCVPCLQLDVALGLRCHVVVRSAWRSQSFDLIVIFGLSCLSTTQKQWEQTRQFFCQYCQATVVSGDHPAKQVRWCLPHSSRARRRLLKSLFHIHMQCTNCISNVNLQQISFKYQALTWVQSNGHTVFILSSVKLSCIFCAWIPADSGPLNLCTKASHFLVQMQNPSQGGAGEKTERPCYFCLFGQCVRCHNSSDTQMFCWLGQTFMAKCFVSIWKQQ